MIIQIILMQMILGKGQGGADEEYQYEEHGEYPPQPQCHYNYY